LPWVYTAKNIEKRKKNQEPKHKKIVVS